MAYLVQPDTVLYACICGLLKPISRLYFCRHCLELRCSYCVCHEVDSHFCGKCLENLPSNEARLKKNRCGNCLDCPSCMQQLSLRAATVGPKNVEDPKASPRKVYYLLCLNCHWSSRDVGIPDQQSSTSSWPIRDNIHMNRLQEVLEMCKNLVVQEKKEKMEREKRKQKKYISYTDKTGITASMLRRRIGLPDIPNPLLPKVKKVEPAVASEDVEQLPEEIFVQPIKLEEITTIKQRLALPDQQPATVDKLFPIHKQLFVKKSMRCRSCEHNVSKPEFNPFSIKFKIQLFAYYHVPEVRIITVEPLRAGQKCELLLKFINPTQHETVITLFQLDLPKVVKEEAVKTPEQQKPLSVQLSSTLLQTKTQSLVVKPRAVKCNVNTDIELPTSSFILPLRDDAADYDDSSDTSSIQDDSKLVIWRKSNKAAIKLIVTPREDSKIGDEIVAGFLVQHRYTNTISSQKHDHKINVFLKLGNLVGST